MINPELQFHHDARIAEILFSDDLKKSAQEGKAASLTDSIKHYVQNHLNPDDAVGSLVNILAPGVVAVAIGGWFGTLLGLAMRVFNIDIYGVFTSIWNHLKPLLSNDQKVNSQQVNDAVKNSVEEHAGSLQSTSVEDATKWKLVLVAYDAELRNVKRAQRSGLFRGKSGIGGILVSVLSWLFKVALASAGLMVAGDVVNKIVGRPNALDNTIQNGKPVEESPEPIHHSSQTKFPLNPNYHEENYNVGETNWIERIPNTDSGIANMLVSFAKEVYAVGSLDDKIKSLPSFQDLLNDIAWYNHASAGDPIVFLPRQFKSKKNVVDFFIDDLAKSTP